MSTLDCRICGSSTKSEGWFCTDRQSPVGDCQAIGEDVCDTGGTNIALVILVVLISLMIAFLISYAQFRSWMRSDRKTVRRYMDEDERLVLHEHPEEMVELT